MALVNLAITDKVGTITLNNNEKRNALGEALVRDLIAALEECSARSTRAVVLRAHPGAQVWSAGHDVWELPQGGRDPLGWDDPLRHLIRHIEEFSAPVIALVEGGIWGGACEVVFACDLILATPDATFAVTPARLGVPYNLTGMLMFLNAAGPRIAKEMAFRAKPVSVVRLEQLGIVNYVVPAGEIEAATYAIAEEIAGNAPLSISVMKEQLRILCNAHPLSPEGFERIQGLRRVVYESNDYLEGIRAFKEKRSPEFKGD